MQNQKNAPEFTDIELKQIHLYRAVRTMQDMDWAMEKLSAYKAWEQTEDKGDILEQDIKAINEALLHSAIVAYIRPFSGNRYSGLKNKDDFVFPIDDATNTQIELHEKLKKHRNISLAHSDYEAATPRFSFNKKGEWCAKFDERMPSDIEYKDFMDLILLIHKHATLTIDLIVQHIKNNPDAPTEEDIPMIEYNYMLRIHQSSVEL